MGEKNIVLCASQTDVIMKTDNHDWKKAYAPAAQHELEEHQGPVLFYNEIVIDHFTNPRNVGEIPDADGYALVGDPSCGDQMKLWIKVENGIITDIKFKSFGCPGAIATSSMATTLALAKPIAAAKQLTDDDVISALGGIPENKRHCSLMGIAALHAAIRDYETKHACFAA
ncbi:MAG: iron-sulfur cluster assembly scaffold protein [Desulfobacterota bacterium]|nr:iron-sulfur cluster assembly scaffold protein [Thermodesulfobacteriota bacterium]